MRRNLPHRATLLRPTTIIDAAGDEVDGPLAPEGDPFSAWLQRSTSTESSSADGGSPVVTREVLYVRTPAPDISEDDVVEVDGVRYRVEGEPRFPVNPRGRARFLEADVERVSRGGN